MNKALRKIELEKWDNRIFYSNKIAFREDGDFEVLSQTYRKSLEKFCIISVGKEITVYKTMRYFIDKHGLTNSLITFLDGRQLESFMDEGVEGWRLKRSIDEFIDLFGEQFSHKWIVIPNLSEAKFDVNIAIYFINKLKSTRAIGIVFHSEEDTSNRDLGSTIATNQIFKDEFLEFPKKNRRIRIKSLEDDGL